MDYKIAIIFSTILLLLLNIIIKCYFIVAPSLNQGFSLVI